MIQTVLHKDGYKIHINPIAWQELSVQERHTVLLHELAHVLRGDCLHMATLAPEERKLWNIVADAVINRTLPDIAQVRWGGVSYDKVAALAGIQAPYVTARLLFERLRKAPNVEDIYHEPLPRDDHGPTESSYDLFPLPLHIRHWVMTRVVWEVTVASQSIGAEDGVDLGDSALGHTKDVRELQEALNQLGDSTEDATVRDALSQHGQHGRRGGRSGVGTTWTPQSIAALDLTTEVLDFLSSGDTYFRRERSYRRQGRWFLYPARPKVQRSVGHIYIDFSGSTQSVWPVLAGLARAALLEGHKVYTFTTEVQVWGGRDFIAGGGTAWAPIAEHIDKTKPGAVVIVTDGEFYDRPKDPGVRVLWLALPGSEDTVKRIGFGRVSVVKR